MMMMMMMTMTMTTTMMTTMAMTMMMIVVIIQTFTQTNNNHNNTEDSQSAHLPPSAGSPEQKANQLLSLDLCNAELIVSEEAVAGTEIPGGGGRGRLYLTLHSHHQNDPAFRWAVVGATLMFRYW